MLQNRFRIRVMWLHIEKSKPEQGKRRTVGKTSFKWTTMKILFDFLFYFQISAKHVMCSSLNSEILIENTPY